ncbi:MAG: bifunctional phosphoglucose/phosphomannose isomerase [Candidatus Thorarchaeota archaeon]
MLDNLEKIKEIDASGMLDILYKFPDQILEIANLIKDVDISELADFDPEYILVLGMGGSAIGGDILASVLENKSDIPILVNRHYHIPKFANKRTLVIACSYSGNTEETICAVTEAKEHGCKLIAITSGGHLEEFCSKFDLPFIQIPKDLPPRAAVLFLFLPMLLILDRLNYARTDFELTELIDSITELRNSIEPSIPTKQNPAKSLALKLNDKIPVIYAHSYLNVIAYRWKTQLNENSKMIAYSGTFPEMNHNEIVGWDGASDNISKEFIVILIRSSDEHIQVSKRIELTKRILLDKASGVLEVDAFGESRLTKMLTTIYLGDYTSVYLALLREIDPTPVKVIEDLKKQLV